MEKVNVLMSTYNGEKYLEEQIESILNQKNVEVNFFVRDDGSTDNTINILDKYYKHNKLIYYSEKNLGPAHSFFDLITRVPEQKYFAFSDQDDVWLPEKLSLAVEKLKKYSDIPALYVSDTIAVDRNLNVLKNQRKMGEEFDFGNILIKNNANGCTMVFNKRFVDIFRKADWRKFNYITAHDHFVYMLCLGIGGKVICDKASYILYRQHSKNFAGEKRSVIRKIKGNGIINNDCVRYKWAETLYENYKKYITEDNRNLLVMIINYKNSMKSRLTLAVNKKIKPKNFIEKIIIFILVILGKY